MQSGHDENKIGFDEQEISSVLRHYCYLFHRFIFITRLRLPCQVRKGFAILQLILFGTTVQFIAIKSQISWSTKSVRAIDFHLQRLKRVKRLFAASTTQSLPAESMATPVGSPKASSSGPYCPNAASGVPEAENTITR